MLTLNRAIMTMILKQELFSYLIGVPLAVYIVIICGNFEGERLRGLLVGVGIAALMVTPFGMINIRRMQKLHTRIMNGGDSAGLADVKSRLFREPHYQAVSIALRWFAATSIAFGVGHLLAGMGLVQMLLLPVIWTVTVPSGYIYTYFITEKGVSPYLERPEIAGISDYRRSHFSVIRKIAFSLTVLLWYPSAIFSLLLYELQNGIITVNQVEINIALILSMMIVMLVSISWLLTSSLKATIKYSETGLRDMAKGNLAVIIPEITADEIGGIARSITRLAGALRKMVSVSAAAVNQMDGDSRTLLGYMEEMSQGGMSVAASMEQMTSAIEELGASSDAIAVNTLRHREFMTRVNGFVDGLIGTVEDFAARAGAASELSAEADRRVEKGNGILTETQRHVADISESTKAISASVDVIRDIADKVNLLSLNASIEAARAGEHGRGFSVVAEEISKLADTTQTNADRIVKTIGEIVKKVQMENGAMEMLAQSFSEIKRFIDETAAFMSMISGDVVRQREKSGELRSLFDELMAMSAENMNAIQEQSKAHQEMVRNAGSVSETMTLFAEKTESVRDMSRGLARRAENLLSGIKMFRWE